VLRYFTVFAVLAFTFIARVASAQPQLTIYSPTAAPGQPVVATVTGTPGHFFALIGSSVNSGFSYAGVPLAVGADVTIITLGTLDGSGTANIQVTPPFVGTTLDRYYLQAVTSTASNFVPPQPGQSAVVRNADLVSASLGTARTGSPTLAIPAGSYILTGIVQVVNNSGSVFSTSCHFTGGFTGAIYPAAIFVPAGTTDTIPLLAAINAGAATTVSVICSTAPGVNIGFTPAIVATPAGSIVLPPAP
jgi:hypothetical protein